MGGNAFSKNAGDAAAGVFARKKSRNYYKLHEEPGDSAFKTDHDESIAGETEKTSAKKIHYEIIYHEKRLTRLFSPRRQASAPKESVNQPAKTRKDAKLANQQKEDAHGKGTAGKKGNIISRIFSRRQPASREPSFYVISSTMADPNGSLARLYRDAEQKAAKERELKALDELKKTTEYHEYAWEPPFRPGQYVGTSEVGTQQQHEHGDQDAIGPATPNNDGYDDISTQIDRGLAGNVEYQDASIKVTCTSCLEELTADRCLLLDCGHHYCGDCINNLFTRSMADDQLFPPRCCRQSMPLDQIGCFLSDDLIQRYHLRVLEMATTDRTYCHNKHCVAFIDPATIVNKTATCQNCSLITCAECKGPGHEGACAPDVALRQFMQTADENGWKRCPTCGTMIELSQGCNHITCRCGHHFCYLCSARWRSCHCPQFQDHNLTNVAQDLIADLNLLQDRFTQANILRERLWDGMPFRPQSGNGHAHHNGPGDVHPIVHFILNRHECTHDVWLNWPGGAQCMICDRRENPRVYRCRRCLYRVCEDCRNNRL